MYVIFLNHLPSVQSNKCPRIQKLCVQYYQIIYIRVTKDSLIINKYINVRIMFHYPFINKQFLCVLQIIQVVMTSKNPKTIDKGSVTSSRRNKTEMPQPTENIEDYIQILYQHQKKCEKEGKYIQAQTAKKRIKQLRQQLEKRMKEQIKYRHQSEKQQIQRAHLDEFNTFNVEWQQKMIQFNQQIKQIENQILQRHQQEFNKYYEEIDKSIPNKPKESAELINLRRIQENLAKVENYMEAHKVQLRIQHLEKQQTAKYLHDRNKKVETLLQQVRTKQESELKALRQKIESGIEQKKKYKSIELQKLLQKYQNVKKELEYQQNQEMGKFQKIKKMQSTINFSKISHK